MQRRAVKGCVEGDAEIATAHVKIDPKAVLALAF
jgi:hypothetical protein